MSAVDGTFTVNDVVIQALRKSGVLGLGQVPDGSDVLDAQNDLSDMLAQWNVKTWMVFNKLQMLCNTDGRSTPYLIGPGSPDINVTPRPDRIEFAFVRILATGGGSIPVDQSLKQIPAYEGYGNVALKKLVAFPKAYFYDPASPTGNLFVYPWPQGGGLYQLGVIMKDVYPLILPLNTDLSTLPPALRPAMKFCLAQRLRQAYGKVPDPSLDRQAKDALATVRNSQIAVPELTMPTFLGRPSHYNIYGDLTY